MECILKIFFVSFTEGRRHYNLLWVRLSALLSFFRCLRVVWRRFYKINPIKFLCQKPKLLPQPPHRTKNLDYIFPKVTSADFKKLDKTAQSCKWAFLEANKIINKKQ